MTCGIVHRLRRLQKEVMALLYDDVLFPDLMTKIDPGVVAYSCNPSL